jgi:hypothetical protein
MVISKSIIKEHMKASKEMITCPIFRGTVLNHHKKLKFGDTDIREIIQQLLYVSLLPRETHVALKMLELELASLAHYEMVLQNAMPIWDSISGNIESISINNRITICDFVNITETRKPSLISISQMENTKKLTYVYEAFGYKKIVTLINKIKKSHPCLFCKGKKVISEDGLRWCV